MVRENKQTRKLSRYCPNCGKVIFAGKNSCEFCSWEDDFVPPKEDQIELTKSSPKTKNYFKIIGSVGFLVILLILIPFVYYMEKEDSDKIPAETNNTQSDKIVKEAPKPIPKPIPKKTPKQYLEEARELLKLNLKDFTGQKAFDARALLTAIPKDTPEYEEAQKLLKELKLKDSKARAIRYAKFKKEWEQEAETKHRLYAKGVQHQSQEEEGLLARLVPLTQKGHVVPAKIESGDKEGLVYVEPLLWKKLTHVEKYQLMQSIMAFYRTHNKLKGSNIEGATLIDMTSRVRLGFMNLETGKIIIKK